MKLSIHKPSKTAVAVTLTVALLSAIGATAVTYYSLKDDLLTQTPRTDNTSAPEGVAQPANLEDKLPEGTVSPTAIFAKPDDYIGKEVKVRGRVIATAPNKFIIVGQEMKDPKALLLTSEGTNIDLNSYVSGFTDEKESGTNRKTVGAVTITGQVTRDNIAGLKLAAKSVEN